MSENTKQETVQEPEKKNYVEVSISGNQLKVMKYIGLVFLFIGLYIILSNLPLFSSPVVNPNAGLALIFITGLLTSVHCVGMCSGFVIAYTTKNPEELETSKLKRVKQHLLYNAGRLSSYTIFGILAGLIGSVFLLTNQFRGYLSIFAGGFMILYGLSTFFPILRRITTIRTPSLVKYTKNRGPLLFGLLNGLMPCGPLQAMLIYAAASGSPLQGGLTMITFGLGTLPLMFGFGNFLSFLSHSSIGKILKVSSVVVMALGLVTLNRGFLLSGYDFPFSNFNLFGSTKISTVGASVAATTGDSQEINMTVGGNGWNPDTFIVQKGVPVKWNIFVEEITSCVSGIRVPKLGLSRDFTTIGERFTFEFTPNEVGTILFTCPMGMVRGEIIVKDSLDSTQSPSTQNLAKVTNGVQTVQLSVQNSNYYPNPIRVKIGIPVQLVADVNNMPGCSKSIVIPEFGIRKLVSAGDNIIEFTPDKSGTFQFSCSMGMYRGQIVVENADGTVSEYTGTAPVSSGGSCGGSGCGCGCGG